MRAACRSPRSKGRRRGHEQGPTSEDRAHVVLALAALRLPIPRRRSRPSDLRPGSSGRAPVAPGRAAACCARGSAATMPRRARPILDRRRRDPPGHRPRSPTRPSRSPTPRAPDAGPTVSARTTVRRSSTPASTAARSWPSAVSRPLIPVAASPYSTSLATSVCGAWSVAMASIVPSDSPAARAAASAGGTERRVDARGRVVRPGLGSGRRSRGPSIACQAQRRSPATQPSWSTRWCGVTSQVTARPRALAARTRSTAAAVERCVRCRRGAASRRSAAA